MLHKLLLAILAASMFAGCQDKPAKVSLQSSTAQTEHKVKTMTQQMSIKIGEQGKDWLGRYPALVKSYKPTPNVTSFAADWDAKPRGVVKIDHGKYSIEIEDVLSIASMQVAVHDGEGLFEYSINAGLSTNNDQGLIAHEEARNRVYAILKRIEQKGWRNLISEDDPRVTGKDRLNYVLTVTNSIGLDTKYVPTLDEWMRIPNLTPWNFYGEHQYLTVYFGRERTLLDPTKPGSYLLTYTLTSEVENYRGYVGADNRKDWKQKLLAALADLKQRRAKAEAALKAQGIKIDETYQDPPLPDLK